MWDKVFQLHFIQYNIYIYSIYVYTNVIIWALICELVKLVLVGFVQYLFCWSLFL